MKKLIAFFSLITSFFFLSSFTVPVPAKSNNGIEEMVKTQFEGATAVSWKEKESCFFANFTVNGKQMSAAYDADGNLLGSSRIISKDEVPAGLLKKAEGNYRNGQAAPYVVELTLKGEVSYYFNVITEKFFIDCHADADGVITEERRMKIQ